MTPAAVRYAWAGLVLGLAAVEALLLAADAGLVGSPLWRTQAWQYGGFWAGLLYGWEPNYALQPLCMFATYAFLHVGWQHCLGNLLALAWLGHALEGRYGAGGFAALYALSMLGAAAGFALIAPGPRPVVGASGAIMGLVAAWIAADAAQMRREGEATAPILRMVAFRVVLIAALNALAWRLEQGALAWQAHLGGFAAAALAMALVPRLRPAP